MFDAKNVTLIGLFLLYNGNNWNTMTWWGIFILIVAFIFAVLENK